MRNLVSEYVSQFRQDRQKQMKLVAVLAALAVVVAGVVFWQLHNTGVAMSNEVYCGMEEHTHDDSCYEQVLICDSEDPDHVHDDSCYTTVLVCGLPEHTHTVDCLTDDTADVETASVWEETLPALTGIWNQDVVFVAESQLGYTESEANYILAEDGTTHQGYNRYGAWYGNEYGDWDAMFVSFCLNYAGIPEEEFPESSGAYAWTADLSNDGLYVDNESFTPAAGDLVFFDEDRDGTADRVGIVVNTDSEDGTITVIEGNSNDAVEENVYHPSDNKIMGYGLLPEQDLGGENIYTVEYDCDEPEYVEISGPESVLEDTNLTFYVTVDLSSGYDIAEATVNGEELLPESVTASEDGKIYTYEYTVENVDEDMAVFLDARQVIDGSGTIGVYLKADEYGDNPDFMLTVSEVPTNTKITLDSPHISMIDADTGYTVEYTLKGLFYYLNTSTNEETEVSYLMLDDGPDSSGSYTVTPYDKNGVALVMSTGILILDSSKYVQATLEMEPIQTNTLCSQDSDGNYQQELVGAISIGSAQSFEVNGYEGAVIRLIQVTDKSEFYYGTLDEDYDDNGNPISVNLKKCSYGVIALQTVERQGDTETFIYTVLPCDENGDRTGYEGSIYMVSDKVYSFDVEVNNVVNEHTEDNGDVYLWTGTQYYVDKYHNQGTTTSNYTNRTPASGLNDDDLGVWVQLAESREDAINNQGKTFADYASVVKDKGEDENLKDLKDEGVTANIISKVSADYNYGIAGPYTVAEGATAEQTTIERITGHIGDEFVASEAFGTETVYMMTDSSKQYHNDWINVGAQATDGGTRAWWYWISDYYKLNNYQDELEYVEIIEDTEGHGEIHLQADEMGEGEGGYAVDVWNLTLFTKRESVVMTNMMNDPETYTKEGVGFSNIAGLPHHVQIRMSGTMETIIDNQIYHGELHVSKEEGQEPTISYKIPIDEEGNTYSDEGTVKMENDQEAEIYYFQKVVVEKDSDGKDKTTTTNYYVPQKYMYDADEVQITVTIYYYGTLTSKDGKSTIEYTTEDPYIYTATLTSAQLKEAYDTCPNNAGYDFAVNLSEAFHQEYSADDITLYKIWDDDDNAFGSRTGIDSVTVTMQRSTDDWATYEDVPYTYKDDDGNLVEDPSKVQEFEITEGAEASDLWSLRVTSGDINLSYKDGDNTVYYQFRITVGSENIGDINEKAGSYTYSDSYYGLTVTNTLDEDFIIIEGVKEWKDAEGNTLDPGDSRIPEEIYMAVYQDDQFYAMQVVTAGDDNKWSFSFDNLPKWRDRYSSEEYEYTLYELAADGTRVGTGDQILLGNNWYVVTIGEPTSSGETTVYEITNQVVAISLPVTGGMGTWIYTAAGLCLIAGAAGVMVYRKRRAVRS